MTALKKDTTVEALRRDLRHERDGRLYLAARLEDLENEVQWLRAIVERIGVSR